VKQDAERAVSEARESDMSRNERDKNAVARRLWLEYFNKSLYSAGLISREEYNKMAARIISGEKTHART